MIGIQKAFGLLVLVFTTVGMATASPPAMTFSEADAVSTADAKAYFLNDADGNARGTTRTNVTSFAYQNSQIEALADALENDPELMFQFVRNNIDLHPVFGVSKGAFGAMLDMEGSAFDQVELLTKLLDYADNSSGALTYTVRVGDVSICNSELEDWTGANGSIASDILVQGGIPIDGTVPDGGGECSSNVTIGHAWLEVDTGSGPEIWDPSYKIYTNPTARDFNSMSGYTAGDAVSSAGGDASTGVANGVPFVSGFNVIDLEQSLNGFTNALVSTFKILNDAGSSVTAGAEQQAQAIYDKRFEDIIGVSRIDVKQTNRLLKAPLSAYASWLPNGVAAFPDQYRVKLDLDIRGSAGQVFDTLVTVYGDEVYGREFALRSFYRDKDLVAPCNVDDLRFTEQTPTFAVSALTLSSPACIGLFVGDEALHLDELTVLRRDHLHSIYVTVDFPYAAAADAGSVVGSYADRTTKEKEVGGETVTVSNGEFSNALSVISDIVIVVNFGQSTEAILAEISKLHGIDAPLPGATFPGFPETENPAYVEYNENNISGPASNSVRYKLVANWLAQYGRFSDIIDGLSRTRSVTHAAIGFAGSNPYLYNPRSTVFPPPQGPARLSEQMGWSVADDSVFVDIRPNVSIAAPSDIVTTVPMRKTHAVVAAGLESAVYAHVMGAVDTNSIPNKFDFAARGGIARTRVEGSGQNSSNMPFYLFQAGTVCETVPELEGRPNLVSIVTAAICTFSGEGLEIVAPASADLGPGPMNSSIISRVYRDPPGGICGSQLVIDRPDRLTIEPASLRNLPNTVEPICFGHDCVDISDADGFGGARYAEETILVTITIEIGQDVDEFDAQDCGDDWVWDNPARLLRINENRGGAMVGWNADQSTISNLLVTMNGFVKGGSTDVKPGEINSHSLPTVDSILGENDGQAANYSIDEKTGLVSVSTGPILSTGTGEGALSFSRTIQSGPRGALEPLWVNNWNIQASFSSSGLETLGAGRPEAAAQSIIAIQALLDVYSDTTASSSSEIIKREVTGPLIMAWWEDQTLHNTLSIQRGVGQEKFTRVGASPFDSHYFDESAELPTAAHETASVGDFWPVAGEASSISIFGAPRMVERSYVNDPPPNSPDADAPFSKGFTWKFDAIDFVHKNARQDETIFEHEELLVIDPWEQSSRSDKVANWGHSSVWLPERTTFIAGGYVDYDLVSNSRAIVGGTITSSHGRSLTFDETSVTDDQGRSVSFTNREVVLLDGSVVNYDFEVRQKDRALIPVDFFFNSELVSLSDWVNEDNHWGVRFVGVKSITQPGYAPGSTINSAQFEYDAMGKISSVTNARNQTWDYASAMGRRSSVTNPQGNSPFTLYDDNGNGYYSSDGYQFATFGTFDGIGRALETRVGSLAYGPELYYARTTFQYDQASNPIVEEMHTRVATTTGTNAFKSYREIYPDNSNYDPIRTVRTYDPTFNVLISEVDGVGTTTVFNTIDSFGRVESTLGPSGELTEYEWDGPFGQLSSSVTKLNATESLQTDFNYLGAADYYQLNSVVVDPSGENVATSMTYDEFGRLESVTDALGRTTSAEYDVMGRMLEIRDAIGGGADYDYYPNGKLKHLKQLKEGGVTANSLIEYSVTGKPVRVVSPDGAETSYVYDFRDWLRDVVDPDGLLTRRIYQPDGRVQRIEKANGTSVHQIEARFWYNYDGSIERLRPARGNQAPQSQTYDTTYRLDAFGRPDTISVFADGTVQVSPLNPDGTVKYSRLRKQTPENHAWDYIYFEYDASKRMTKQRERHRGRTPEWRDTKEYSYDLAGRLLREFETGDDYTFDAGVDEEVIFDYDKLGRVKSETQNGRTVSYQYDKLGNRKRMTWPDGLSVDYDYDALNRLDSVRFGSNTLVDYSYDLRGRMKTADFNNGTVTNFTFNNDNQMEGLGYVLKDEQGLAETLSWVHGYTPAGRLSQTNLLDNKHPSWAPSVAELISYTAPSLPGEAANVLDQYEQVSRNLVSKLYVYDDRGNLTSVGLTVGADYTNYQYNFENRLVSGTRGTTSFAYDYDVSGRRVGKIVDGLESRFLYAGDMEIAEYDAAGTVLRRYIPGGAIDSRVAYIEGAGTSLSDFKYYHADRLGNVAALSDAAGNVSDRYAYDPFGNEVTGAGLGGQLFRYTGRKFDPETGLYFYRARYYDPDLGRFLSTDPIGYADQWNLYTYVGNDPLNATDPTGKNCVTNGPDGDQVFCDHPDSDVPDVSFPRPEGWPPYIGSTPGGNILYHDYDYQFDYGNGGEEKSSEGQERAATNPTPGSNDQTASPSGVINDVGHIALKSDNLVKSYVMPRPGGLENEMMIVNVTLPGHEVFPGYIVQFFDVDQNGSVTAHVAGEGLALTQSNFNPIARFLEWRVWSEQVRQYQDNDPN